MSDYALNTDDINLNIWISTGASAASFILCAAVLGAAGWVWSYPHFRMYLDRVSFRLLLWSMVFELAYDVAYIAVELYSFYGIQGGACGAGVYFMMAFMGVVNYLCTAIAVNLALTISFGMNPIKQRLERWYVGVSIALGMFIPIIPAGLGHFGYDPILDVCWITAHSDAARLRNFVLDLYMWQILSCVVATASVIMVLITLIRQSRATSAALYAGNKLNRDLFSSDDEDLSAGGGGTGGMTKRKRKYLWARIASFSTASTSSRGSDAGSRPHRMSHTMSQLEDRFFRIALKISAYPVALIVVNVIITAGDLVISRDGGVYSRSAYALYCIYYFLYGGRGIVFAFLAFFIDPCLRFGLRAVIRAKFDPARSMPGIELESSRIDTTERSFSEMLAMPDPSTDPASYDEDKSTRRDGDRSGRGLTQGRRAKSGPGALRFGRSRKLQRGLSDDIEKGVEMRATQSMPGVANLDFDAPGWGGLEGVYGERRASAARHAALVSGHGHDRGGRLSPLRRASSTSSVDALKMQARDSQTERGSLSASIDMPAALGELAFEAEHSRYLQREVSPRSTAPSTPNLNAIIGAPRTANREKRTSFHLPLNSPKALSPRLGRKSFSSRLPSPMKIMRSPSSSSVADGDGPFGMRRTSHSDLPSRHASPAPAGLQSTLGTPHHPTRSFVGVDVESLPPQMTDNVDFRRPSVPVSSQHPAQQMQTDSMGGDSPAREQTARGTSPSHTPISSSHPSRTSTPPCAADAETRRASQAQQGSTRGSCIALPHRSSHASQLESLHPDLPNATEEAIRRIRAAREQKRQEKEAAIMAFLQTKAML